MAKAVAGLQSSDLAITLYQSPGGSEADGLSQPPLITVKLTPKDLGVSGQAEGVPPNAKR